VNTATPTEGSSHHSLHHTTHCITPLIASHCDTRQHAVQCCGPRRYVSTSSHGRTRGFVGLVLRTQRRQKAFSTTRCNALQHTSTRCNTPCNTQHTCCHARGSAGFVLQRQPGPGITYVPARLWKETCTTMLWDPHSDFFLTLKKIIGNLK